MIDKKSLIEIIDKKAKEANQKKIVMKEERPLYPILDCLQKNYISKWQKKNACIDDRLIDIEGEERMSITNDDKTEAKMLVTEKEKIEEFLNDLDGLKKYVEYQERIYTKENEEENILLIDPIIDNIKLICRTYLNSFDTINENDNFSSGMRTAYKIILECIKGAI
jgi:hypothetical protein